MKRLKLVMALLLILILAVPVSDIHAAVSYKLNKTTQTITGVGKTFTLTVTAPSPYSVTWKSSNTKIANVSASGVVTAKTKGTAAITCTVKHNNVIKKLTCKITVKVPSKAIVFTNAVIDDDLNAHIIELGSTYNFGSKRISSSNKSASSDVIRYYIGDTAKATVDGKTGVVTPLKTGMTTLTVCAGATAAKAKAATNTVKQTINIYIKKPVINVTDCALNNSTELKITFDHAMDSSKLITSSNSLTGNISITPNTDAASLGTLSGTLSDDKKSLIISNTSSFKGSYTIKLTSDILSKTGYPLTAYSEIKVLEDTVKPTFLGCTLDDSGMVVSMNFSEPISISDLRGANPKRTDGKSLTNSALFTTKSNYTLSDDKKSILLDLSSLSSSDQNVAIEITLYGILDLANNTTNPYPLTVQVYTNTSTQTQAVLTNLYRNGNSLVAQFNKSIQTPGYAQVNSTVVTGVVNSNNKKEVIYHMTDSSLLNLTGTVSVSLTNFSTYNTTTLAASTQRSVYFGSTAALPAVTGSTFTTVTKNSQNANVLTLTFNSYVTVNTSSGYLTGTSNIDGVISAATPYAYTASASGKTVSITFSDTFSELAEYTFTLPAKFVTDCCYNDNALQTITVTKLTGTSEALAQPSGIQIGGTNKEYVYVTFPAMLDTVTAQDKSNYSISGINILSASLLSNNYNCPAIVKLQVNPNTIESDVPYQITISGIKGYKGSYASMNTYQTMITLSNNKTLESSSMNAYASTNTFVISFASSISTASRISYTATVNNQAISIKSSQINGNTITFTFSSSIASGSVIVLKPDNNNSIIDVNNQKLLNTSLSAVVS